MERKDIAALLQSLCEHPLADGQAQSSPELEALRRAAAQAFREDNAARGEGSDAIEATRLRAALAALMSGTAGEGERRIVADAVLQSPAARLDVQSAQAFVGAVEHLLQSVPPRVLDEILAREGARSSVSAAARNVAESANIWPLIVGRSWSARGWRVAALCTLLLVMSVAPVYRMQQIRPLKAVRRRPWWKHQASRPLSSMFRHNRNRRWRRANRARRAARPAKPSRHKISRRRTRQHRQFPRQHRTVRPRSPTIRPKRSRQSPRAIGQRRHGRPPARAMPPRSAPRAPTTRPMAA